MTEQDLLGYLRDAAQGASNSAASTVSGPVDLLAWLLNKGGIPVQNPVLGSDWMAQKGMTAKPANALAGMAGETLGNISPIVAAAKAPQIANALLRAEQSIAPTVANMAERYMVKQGMIQPATVWHGSPHKFDKFDASKIGTGEGAQAYGHGLYLADAPSVAQSYADTLSQYHIATKDGVKAGGDFADALVSNAGQYPASLSSAIRSQANKIATDLAGGKTAEQVVSSMRNGPYARMYAGLADAAEKLSPAKAVGALYKVDLPDEHIAKMLDWDVPLSNQSPAVRDALSSAGVVNLDAPFVSGLRGSELYKRARNGAPAKLPLRQVDDEIFAAQRLREAGIPGIRYLDGGSRGAGSGTSNYVVFPGNENLLRILERNGVPIGQ